MYFGLKNFFNVKGKKKKKLLSICENIKKKKKN